MRIFLVGFMGCGKSTTGRRLARELGARFVDLDREVEMTEGASLMDIFRYEGEEVFRGYERAALERVCEGEGSVVVATGGGTPCYGDNMEYMNARGLTVYLRHSAGQLAQRLSVSHNPRPLLRGKSEAELYAYVREKLSEREEVYMSSTLIIEGLSRNIKPLVEIIRNKCTM